MVICCLRDVIIVNGYSVNSYLLPCSSCSPAFLNCSVREICGKEDVDIAYKHFKAFYKSFSSIDRKLNVD